MKGQQASLLTVVPSAQVAEAGAARADAARTTKASREAKAIVVEKKDV